jgi:hypothetical protein
MPFGLKKVDNYNIKFPILHPAIEVVSDVNITLWFLNKIPKIQKAKIQV